MAATQAIIFARPWQEGRDKEIFMLSKATFYFDT